MNDVDVKIVMTGHGLGEVFLSGQKIENVRAVRFEAEAGHPNKFTIELQTYTIEIEGPAVVTEVK